MPSYNILVYTSLYIAIIFTSPFVPNVLTTAYYISSPNAISAHSLPQHPTSALASKVIYESPSIENIYKEFLVTSKPVALRKYGHGMKKTKKTKKDSKIYFIPIPPMPYRFIPGVGYDYQPVKINPIMKEGPTTNAPDTKQMPTKNEVYNFDQYLNQNKNNKKKINAQKKQDQSQMNNIRNSMTTESTKDSQIIRMDINDHGFNGRPHKLQVARAQQRHRLNVNNLKSKFYLNKNIIY